MNLAYGLFMAEAEGFLKESTAIDKVIEDLIGIKQLGLNPGNYLEETLSSHGLRSYDLSLEEIYCIKSKVGF
jgi:hypothetical protein